MTQLVASAQFRDNVRALGEGALAGFPLTTKERARAIRLASERGVRVTATLVESFRLGKIIKLVPLTRTLLGDARLAEEARAFWLTHPPRSFYAVDEVIAFCDYLTCRSGDGLDVPYLGDVLSLERAMLDLRRPRASGGSVSRVIRFHHDPAALLGPLTSGRVPQDIAAQECALLATVHEDGSTDWSRAVEDDV